MSQFIAYHGTNSEKVESIKRNGFKPSISHNEWLGNGVYFFIDGSFCPIKNAREWGKNNAWNNAENKNTYTHYSILKVCLRGERVLDLRSQKDLEIFEKLRVRILKKYEQEKSNFKIKPHPDTFLCNSISKSMKLDILIQNLYIKTKYQKIHCLSSRIANTTVLCAKETAKIDLTNIEEVEKKEIIK